MLSAAVVVVVLTTSITAAQAPPPPTVAAPATAPAPRPNSARAASRQAPEPIRVRTLDISGADAVSSSRLKTIIQTKQSSRLPWGRKRLFDRSSFETDLRRIEAFYADRGYPDARVSFDAALSEDQRSIDLTVVVDEGVPVIIDQVEVEGLIGVEPARIASLKNRLPIAPGDVRDAALVTDARAMVARTLQDRGYPFSRVAVEERASSGDQRRVTIALVALVGEEASFGSVEVEGNLSVNDDIIRRALAFESGERFNLSAISVSQRRLYDLELFRLVNIENVTEGVRGGQVPIRVKVAEADHRQLQFGVGYGSEERLRGETKLRHVNFLGGARTAGVEAKWSSLDRGIRADFRQPYLFRPDLAMTLSAQRWFVDEPAYTLHTRGGRATFTQQLSQPNVVSGRGAVSSLAVSWIYEREQFTIAPEFLADVTRRDELIALGLDPRTGAGGGLLNALAVDFRRSTTASVLDARRGYVVEARAERGGGWIPGDFNYAELSLEGRHYQTLGRMGVLANRVRVATIDSRDDQPGAVPFFKRYFLGGSNSLRGWGRFEVSPLEDGLPIGGQSLIELSTELRIPLFGRFGLVTFLDAGHVDLDPWKIRTSQLRYDAGPGFRYASPVGPIRVDIGFQLNRIPGLLVDGEEQLHPWRIHFSIGQTF